MAVLFCDSFDHYTTTAQLLLKWTAATGNGQTLVGAYGRNGTNGLRIGVSDSRFIKKTLPTTVTTLICGTAFRTNSLPGGVVLAFLESGTVQVDLRLTATGKLYVTRNGTQLGANGLTTLLANTFYYLELKVKVHGSTGTVDVRLNGASEISLTAQNTQATANAFCDQVQLSSWFVAADFDDCYICDTLGAQNADFMGDVRIQGILPTAAGNKSQWAPTPATNNYSRVNETTPDDDTSYVADATVGDIDTYVMGDLIPTTGLIKAIQFVPYARKDDAGTRTIAPVLRIGGVDYVQPNLPNLGTTYVFLPEVVELSPATGVAFTVAEINAMEAGMKVIA